MTGLQWNTPLLGVFRHFETVGIYTCLSLLYTEQFSGDNLLMAAIALKGKIAQVPELLLQRIKGDHQTAGQTPVHKHRRIDVLQGFPDGLGIRLPALNFIQNHCAVLASSDLPPERRDELMTKTVMNLLNRYQTHIHFELTRAASLIARTRFRQGWEDDIKEMNKEPIDAARRNHLDFFHVAKVSKELDYAATLVPKFPGLHFARAVLYNAVSRNKEAQLALTQELENNPNHQPSKNFLSMLTRKVS